MRDHLWPTEEPLFEDVFGLAVDPDRGRPIEDKYGCVQFGDETRVSRMGVTYHLTSLGILSIELLQRADLAEYERLRVRLDRRRGNDECPWMLLAFLLSPADEAALLQALGLTVTEALARFCASPDRRDSGGGSRGEPRGRDESIVLFSRVAWDTKRWHRAEGEKSR